MREVLARQVSTAEFLIDSKCEMTFLRKPLQQRSKSKQTMNRAGIPKVLIAVTHELPTQALTRLHKVLTGKLTNNHINLLRNNRFLKTCLSCFNLLRLTFVSYSCQNIGKQSYYSEPQLRLSSESHNSNLQQHTKLTGETMF